MGQTPHTSPDPESLESESRRQAKEYRDEQAALLLLKQWRSSRPLRHSAPLESNLQDLLDEWYRRE